MLIGGAKMRADFPPPARRNLAATFGIEHNGRWPSDSIRGGRMYAICFDLDQDLLKRHYPAETHTNGYDAIRRVLERFGFNRQQGSVYFGDQHVTPVTCVMAVQAVQKAHPWFGKVVRDIRMLRIEEHNDLMPAISQQELQFTDPAPVAT
jgi:virulence-associated protein VapD